MSLAASQLENFEVMIISRGRGRGHAVPDMAIALKLIELLPNLSLKFVSYAAGAEAYRACGYEVLDLQVPENPPFLDMVIAFTRLLGQTRPRLVIVHEEIPVLPAAQVFEIPCIFITDFFTDPNSLLMQALQYAAEVVFTAEPGLYTEPPHLRCKVHYVGRAVRQFEYTLADRDRARRELGVPPSATVALCQPGGWVESKEAQWGRDLGASLLRGAGPDPLRAQLLWASSLPAGRDPLPQNRVPERSDWARLSGRWTRRINERIADLERLRAGLTECIGCGCLSLDRCQLANPGHRAARRGPGPRYWMDAPRRSA